MSLRIRLTVLIGVVATVAMGAIAWASYSAARDEARAEVDTVLEERAGLVGAIGEFARQFEGQGPGQGQGPGRPPFEGNPPIPRQSREGFIRDDIMFQAFDVDGTVVIPEDGIPVLPIEQIDLDTAAGVAEPEIRDIEHGGVHYRMITTAGPEQLGVQMARDLTEIDAFLSDLRIRLLIIGLIGVAALAVVAWFLARRAVRPVAQLTTAAEHVAATTSLDAPIDVDRSDEIGRLGLAFNRMLGALDTSRRQQERLVADAGHELRTPLTSLRTNIEVLAAKAAEMSPDDRDELLADATYELEQLTALVTELVELAGDSSSTDHPKTEVRLDHIVAEVAERSARRTGRIVEQTTDETTVLGRTDDLRRAVANLLDNAHKWSPPGAAIEVVQTGGSVEVLDRGPGIPKEDLERVFERFHRAEDARTTPGSGLGLAIVRQIVINHGGRVWALRREGGGSAVGFEVPVET